MLKQLSTSVERNSLTPAGLPLFLTTLQCDNFFGQFYQSQSAVDNLSLFEVHITVEFNPKVFFLVVYSKSEYTLESGSESDRLHDNSEKDSLIEKKNLAHKIVSSIFRLSSKMNMIHLEMAELSQVVIISYPGQSILRSDSRSGYLMKPTRIWFYFLGISVGSVSRNPIARNLTISELDLIEIF